VPIKWIVFNGPPRSGKSSAANWLRNALHGISVRERTGQIQTIGDSFAMPMKHFIATAFGEKYQDMDKEKMRPELLGRTAREFLIHMSEHYMKDRYGDDVFARWLVYRNLKNIPLPDYVVIDDGGFEIERDALTKPRVIRMIRPGTSFKGDSRSYWSNPTVTIENDGTHDHMYHQITTYARQIIDEDKGV
jgi:hypothetical protein